MKKNFFNIENNFYKLAPFSRLEKFIIQLELFKKSIKARGDIIEFGVYKGNSLIRLISLNKIYNKTKKKVFAFDVFNKFPIGKNEKDKKQRKNFIKNAGESSIKVNELSNISETVEDFIEVSENNIDTLLDLDEEEDEYCNDDNFNFSV